MKIKHPLPRVRRWKIGRWAAVCVGVILLGVDSLGSAYLYEEYGRRILPQENGKIDVTALKAGLLGAPNRYFEAFRRRDMVETLRIDIKFKRWQLLLKKRQEALHRGILLVGPNDEVKAKVTFRGQTMNSRIRLKGDWTDHLRKSKAWSLRIKIKGGDHVWGMRRFSVQHPGTRANYAEPLFLEHMRMEGVLAPRYEFARVVVNGTDWGIMAVEEHFSKELLENQGRKEGIIGRLDESIRWAYIAENKGPGPYNNVLTASFKAFSSKKAALDPVMKHQLDLAAALFAGLQEGRLTPSDVFDVDAFAKFIVVCELWTSGHALDWHNQRFYLNPYSLKFEPIAYDNSMGVGTAHMSQALRAQLSALILRDEEMQEAVQRHYRRIVDHILDGDVIERLSQKQKEVMAYIALDRPYIPMVELAGLRRNAHRLASMGPDYLDPNAQAGLKFKGPFRWQIKPRVYQNGTMVINNMVPSDVLIEEIRLNRGSEKIDQEERIPLGLTIAATSPNGRPSSVSISMAPGFLEEPFVAKVFTRVSGEAASRVATVEKPIPWLERHPLSVAIEPEVIAHARPWLDYDREKMTFVVRQGNWKIEKPLVLPQRTKLRIPAGVTLEFGELAYIVVQGSLDMLGTAIEPINLRPMSAARWWMGLYVDAAGARSTWQHVTIEKTAATTDGYLRWTGGVTIRRSQIAMTHVEFLGSIAEDALNLVDSKFEIRFVRIKGARSDALDSDFSSGSISDGLFEVVGGDAIDISGSNVELSQIAIKEAQDKAISVGEGSRLEARDILMRDVGIGVVAKDLSEVEISDSRIESAQVAGLMAYVKKAEYGVARIIAERIEFVETREEAIAQLGSSIVLEGQDVPGQPLDVELLYKEGPMKK